MTDVSDESEKWLALQDALAAKCEAVMRGQESGEPRGIVNTPGLVFPWLPPAGWRKNLDEGS